MDGQEETQLPDGTIEEIATNATNLYVRKQGQNFASDAELEAAQGIFLRCLAEYGVILHSCRIAHIAYTTYQRWLEEPDFLDACKAAMIEHREKVYLEVDRRGRKGIQEVVISGGKLITDKKGKAVVVRKYSDRLLEAQYNRYFPAQAVHNGSLLGFTEEVQNGNGDTYIHLPWSAMTEEEQNLIEAIGRNIEARERNKAMN